MEAPTVPQGYLGNLTSEQADALTELWTLVLVDHTASREPFWEAAGIMDPDGIDTQWTGVQEWGCQARIHCLWECLHNNI